jgi:ankyrin repeat protein
LEHAQDGWTALILAAREGHADCARLLIDAGAYMNATDEVRAVSAAPSAVVLALWNGGDE